MTFGAQHREQPSKAVRVGRSGEDQAPSVLERLGVEATTYRFGIHESGGHMSVVGEIADPS